METLETIHLTNPLARIGVSLGGGVVDYAMKIAGTPTWTDDAMTAYQKARHDAMMATIQNTR